VTSAGIVLYGQVLWDPLRLIDHWDNRPAAFFASFAFALGTLGTNVSANSLSAGNDMAALWPRYINIQRGQVICAILGGWTLCPWEILARCVRLRRNSGERLCSAMAKPHSLPRSASGFLAFMGGYTVFIAPITGIVTTDVSKSPRNPFSLVVCPKEFSIFIADFMLSIGSYTALMSTFPQCISLMEGTGIHMVP
jgi:NCS1 family nucleobase:cation symporter-1